MSEDYHILSRKNVDDVKLAISNGHLLRHFFSGEGFLILVLLKGLGRVYIYTCIYTPTTVINCLILLFSFFFLQASRSDIFKEVTLVLNLEADVIKKITKLTEGYREEKYK